MYVRITCTVVCFVFYRKVSMIPLVFHILFSSFCRLSDIVSLINSKPYFYCMSVFLAAILIRAITRGVVVNRVTAGQRFDDLKSSKGVLHSSGDNCCTATAVTVHTCILVLVPCTCWFRH